jgi:hypothetical protein
MCLLLTDLWRIDLKFLQTQRNVLYRIIASEFTICSHYIDQHGNDIVCSHNHMQHTVALFVQNAEFSGINKAVHVLNNNHERFRDKWVPVTMARRVLRMRMEERPQILMVAANILNKQSRTAERGWSSRFGVVWCANFSWKTLLHGVSKF